MQLFQQSTLYQIRNLSENQYDMMNFGDVPKLKSQYKNYKLF